MNPNTIRREEAVDLFGVIEATVDAYSPQLPLAMRQHVSGELRQAFDELMQGRGTDAVTKAQAIFEKTQMPTACLFLAVALLETQQPLSALAALYDLEQSQTGFAEGNLITGLILYAVGRPDGAHRALQAAVARKPELLPAWKLLIQMAMEEKGLNGAFLVFQEALQYSVQHPKLLSLQSCLRQKPSFTSTAVMTCRSENSPPMGASTELSCYAEMIAVPV